MCSPGCQPGSPNPPSLPPHSDSIHFIACLVESNSQIPGQDSISRPNECQARALTTMPRSNRMFHQITSSTLSASSGLLPHYYYPQSAKPLGSGQNFLNNRAKFGFVFFFFGKSEFFPRAMEISQKVSKM